MQSNRIIQVEEKVPPRLLVPLSIQHMFAMFGASVLVPFIFKMNPAIVLFMNGIGTLLFILSYQSISVLIVSLLSNLGKLFPVFFYRDRKLSERLALSIGMFTRGEVGAGVIFIALGYNLGGPVLIVSVLTIVLNLILTGGFVLLVKRLALKAYGTQPS